MITTVHRMGINFRGVVASAKNLFNTDNATISFDMAVAIYTIIYATKI